MVAVESGARLSFLPTHQQGPVLVIEWANPSTDYTIESHDTVTKLLWLSSASIFRELDLGSLTEIAASVEIRRYAKDVWLCHAGEAAKDAFLLQAGSADVLIERDGQTSLIGKLQEGALIGELGVITGRPRVASARISSPMARVLTIQGERLRALMERDSTVSMSMLTVVAGYVKN
jgi:CRP-like cAMP-binding protein